MPRTTEDQSLIDTLSAELATARSQLESQALEHQSSLARLRHDLRGILSPALLLADRLSMSADPVAQRTADAMIQTIERAEAALRTRE